MYYDELLKMFLFEEDEIERERPRIERAFKKLGIGPDDVARAEVRVKKHFDLDLKSTRMFLGYYLRRTINLALCREEYDTVIYVPFGDQRLNTALAQMDGVFVEMPMTTLQKTLGDIFDKITPIFEAAEANGMPGVQCSFTQVDLGAISLGLIPPPDIAVAGGFYCDQAYSPYEIIRERYGTQVLTIDGCWDSQPGEYPILDSQRVLYLGKQIKKTTEELEKLLGRKITEKMLQDGLMKVTQVFTACDEARLFATNSDPLVLSMVDSCLSRMAPLNCVEREGQKRLLPMYATLMKEMKKRVDEGFAVVPKGAPRMTTTEPPYSMPELLHHLEECGVHTGNWGVPWTKGVPVEAKPEWMTNIYDMFAFQSLATGFMYTTGSQLDIMERLIELTQVDGVLWFNEFGCRMCGSGAQAFMAKKIFEEKFGIPTMPLEMSLLDVRHNSLSALKTRIETFAELLKVRKAARARGTAAAGT